MSVYQTSDLYLILSRRDMVRSMLVAICAIDVDQLCISLASVLATFADIITLTATNLAKMILTPDNYLVYVSK